ncbi:hypothetical protein EV102420_34_00330 [Pseudescherichia vulneris NBRC 102420]|uniref:Uncharacterized protein n=1 Tax=Pseudescherichia vulneris NBRC 102420 TaxID=1115515 RepID=A0A090V664_PSEVU|nr:hypothetical protein [Pseudescherichia vulneris]GAL60296.1 hypothetical protein EV102420_34_00330 [Pseudescherichia vulneris NBRC 102420]STQ61097.1 putative lytic transglycosylase, catalytic [Pseudescherichia vulneris]
MSGSVKAVKDFFLSLGLDIEQIDTDKLTVLFEQMTAALPEIGPLAESTSYVMPQIAKSLEKASRLAQCACDAIAPSFIVAERVYKTYIVADAESILPSTSSFSDGRRSAMASTLRRLALEATSDSDIPSVNHEVKIESLHATRRSRKVPDWIAPFYHSAELLYQPSAWLMQSQIAAEPSRKETVINHASIQNISQLMQAAVQHIALRGNMISMLNTSTHNAENYLNVNQQSGRNVNSMTSVHQQNTYNIYGSNAREIASEVEMRQHSANARIMRANQSGVG